MIVRMWEGTVAPGRLDDAVEWVRRDAVPRALATPGCLAAEILSHEGSPERVLLVTRWDAPPRFEEGWPEDELLVRGRAAHYETI